MCGVSHEQRSSSLYRLSLRADLNKYLYDPVHMHLNIFFSPNLYSLHIDPFDRWLPFNQRPGAHCTEVPQPVDGLSSML